MKALLRAAKGTRRELKSISAPPCRSCSSSQPWFPPPRYWEADPNAGNASSPAPSRPNSGYPGGGMQQQRGMVPPPAGIPAAPPGYVPGDFRPQQQQMPQFGAAMQHVPPPISPSLPGEARTWNSGIDEPGGFSKLASFQQVPRMQSQPQPPPASSSIPNTASNVSEAFTGLIESFHRRGMLLEVDNVLKGMRAAQIVASMATYRALIDLYSQHGDFDRMDAVYLEMKRAMLKPPGQQQVEATPQQKQEASQHFGSLVDACHKKGLLEEISSIYKAMKAADLVISIPTYKILIETFSQLRDCEKMDAVYMEMREIMKKSAIRGIGSSATFSQAGNPWTGSSSFRQEVPGGFNPVARPPPYGESMLPAPANRGQHPQISQFQGPPHFQAMNHLQQQQQQHPPPPPPYGAQQFQPPPGSVHGGLQYPGMHQGHHPPSAVPPQVPYASPPPGQAGQVPFQGLGQASVPPGYVPLQQFQAQQAPPSPVTAAAQMAAASVSAQQVQFQQAAPVVVQQEEEGDETVEEEQEQQSEEVEQIEAEEQHQEVEASAEATAEEEEEQEQEQESIGEMEEVGHDTLESMVTGEQGNHEQQQQQQQLMESTG